MRTINHNSVNLSELHGTEVCFNESFICPKFQLEYLFTLMCKVCRRRKQSKTFGTHISEIAGGICFKFGMHSNLPPGWHLCSRIDFNQISYIGLKITFSFFLSSALYSKINVNSVILHRLHWQLDILPPYFITIGRFIFKGVDSQNFAFEKNFCGNFLRYVYGQPAN